MTLTIGPTSRFAGDLTSQEDVLVHGTVKGQIVTESGTVRVAPQGHVEADVRASIVTIDGTFDGRITASTRVDLTATARVTGSLTTPVVVLRDGASFNGTIEIARKQPSKTAAAIQAVGVSSTSSKAPVRQAAPAPSAPGAETRPGASRAVNGVNAGPSTVGVKAAAAVAGPQPLPAASTVAPPSTVPGPKLPEKTSFPAR